MQAFELIQCPFCGEAFEIPIDLSVADQHFTTDCDVCCRPFEVRVECQGGELVNIEVLGN
jgi:hypothetical protein